jgi:uncharacterized protein YkwD
VVLGVRAPRLSLVAAILAAIGLGTSAPSNAAPPDTTETMERDVASRVDEIRLAQGRGRLKRDAILARVARRHACWLSSRGTLSHEGPSGETVADRVQAGGKSFRTVAENLARSVNVPDPVAAAIDGWMRSPGHRENILREDVTETGVGICRVGTAYYVTQVFLRPAVTRPR